ncbi:MAG: helix-turn-helix domain-containing protein [archaeon]|jgi:sugar-specific transcriptional regulator TrmB
MNSALLEKIGLSKGEIKVFLALNRLGESTVGKIVSESEVSKSKVYDILEKLIRKGLAGYIVREDTKYFFVNNPHTLLDFVVEKENQIKKVKSDVENLLPSLEAQRATFSASRFAEIYEGYNGLKSIRMELLESMRSGEELLVLGAPRVANEKMEGWLLDFHKVRLKKKVSMKIIYNENVHDFGSKRERMKLTQVHYMPNNISTPTWVDVFPNAVFIGIITSKPVAFVVRDKEAADSFRNYFNLLWGISVK